MYADPPTNGHISPKPSFEQAELKYRNRNRVGNLSNSSPRLHFYASKSDSACVSQKTLEMSSPKSRPTVSLCHALHSEA